MSANSFIELDRVVMRYKGADQTLALDGASFEIGKGEFVAVVGPSGCGKSSLMKLVTGLMTPTSGVVRVDGRTVAGPLKICGMAFQNSTLLPWRTTLSNVMLPLEIVRPHRGRLRRDWRTYLGKAEALLATVGLAGFEKRYPWMLSGGMQQRANLCRALIHDPEFLVLDEPFGALDAFTREELWSVLQDLWLERRFTCMLVTHDLREAAYLADKIIVMSARPGRVIAIHDVDLPRPRTLESTFDSDFLDLVHAIRNRIAQERHESKAGIPTGRADSIKRAKTRAA